MLHEDTYKVVDLRQEEPGRKYASTAHTSQLKIWRPQEDDDASAEPETDDEVDLQEPTESKEDESNREDEQVRGRDSEDESAIRKPA